MSKSSHITILDTFCAGSQCGQVRDRYGNHIHEPGAACIQGLCFPCPRCSNERLNKAVNEGIEAIEKRQAFDAKENNETRITDPDTGGQKGTKPARFDLVPWEQIWKVAELYGKGAEKYDEHNWRLGYAWSLSFAAMLRHAVQFWNGESIDPELGTHHLTSVIFHALALMEFEQTHPEKDDRYVSKKEETSHE